MQNGAPLNEKGNTANHNGASVEQKTLSVDEKALSAGHSGRTFSTAAATLAVNGGIDEGKGGEPLNPLKRTCSPMKH
ncbi:MAG: hypothetical protein NTX03_00870 [Bacteroidetes bacterium]|nr:hypothetical protein [Bacteroidota bacterium]